MTRRAKFVDLQVTREVLRIGNVQISAVTKVYRNAAGEIIKIVETRSVLTNLVGE